MAFNPLLLTLLPLGLDTFATSLGIGLKEPSPKRRLRIALAFLVAETVMPIIGVLIGAWAHGVVSFMPAAAGLLLILIGIRELIEDWLPKRKQASGPRPLYLLALAASLDELGLGAGLGGLNITLWMVIVWLGLQALLASLLGQSLGGGFASRAREVSERLAAVAFIFIGVLMVFGLL